MSSLKAACPTSHAFRCSPEPQPLPSGPVLPAADRCWEHLARCFPRSELCPSKPAGLELWQGFPSMLECVFAPGTTAQEPAWIATQSPVKPRPTRNLLDSRDSVGSSRSRRFALPAFVKEKPHSGCCSCSGPKERRGPPARGPSTCLLCTYKSPSECHKVQKQHAFIGLA